MKECLIEISPFEGWHPAIFASLAVEEQVCGQDCASHDGSAVKELGAEGAGVRADGSRWLDVGAVESVAGFDEG